MQLGIISTAGVRCGISTYSSYLSEALRKLGVGVTILAERPFPDDSALDLDFKTDVPFFRCWFRHDNFSKLIEESKNYDLFHIQHQYGLFPNEHVFINLLRKIKIPLMTTLHDITPFNPGMANYFNEIIRNSKKIIVHTKTCKSMLLSWNCPEKKIVLITHGTKLINVPTQVEARKALELPIDAEIILSWGFIWESKGILDLVKIHTEILKTHPKAIFVHVGGVHPAVQGSTYLKKILQSAVKSGLTPKNFMITQWVPEDRVPLWFGTADLIVLNYMRGSASASGAAHRAMAAGKPLVGTDDPCLEEIPKLESPRFDVNSLYQNIKKVLEDKKLASDLAKRATIEAKKTSWLKTAKLHLKLYNQVLPGRRDRR